MISGKFSTIILEREQSHLRIILNRPEKRNALNQVMVEELTHVFTETDKDREIRTISIRGNEKAFCSGADLDYLKSLHNFSWEDNYQDSRNLANLYLKIYNNSKPVLAIVTGPALAGGCGLATACDLIISNSNSKFGYPEVKIGFVASIVSVFLIRQIGERRARYLLLTGDIINANQALNMGLINEVVENDKIEERIKAVITNLHQCAPGSLSSTKKLFESFYFTNLDEQIEIKARQNADFRQTDHFSEGVTSFIEKRKPNWVK